MAGGYPEQMRPELPKGGGGQGGPAKGIKAGPPRGARQNPKNRFEVLARERDPDLDEAEEPLPRTQFIPDLTQSIITRNDSPDIPYGASLNPYRGCEHGCVYCYARPTHEYLGFSAGLDL